MGWSGEIERCIHQNHVFRRATTSGVRAQVRLVARQHLRARWFEAQGSTDDNLASPEPHDAQGFPRARCRRSTSSAGSSRRSRSELSAIDAVAVRRSSEHSAAPTSLRRAVLERAFRGELVPQDPSDEPASALLERIRAEAAEQPARPRRRRVQRMSTQNGLVQRLWNYCNVLRDDGLSYGDYLEQLTYLLFLKMADEQTKPPFDASGVRPGGPRLAEPARARRRRARGPLPARPRRSSAGSRGCSASSSARRRTRSRTRPSCAA